MKWDLIFNKKNHQGIKAIQEKLKQLGFKKTFKIFNVVGTNGKGSVSKYLNDSFIGAGKKVGLFTSPHVFKPNERIKINNKNISNKRFFRLAKNLDFSFFEILFIVAMLHFQKSGIDVAIIEAGIGGTKDTTNSVNGDYGVVTSIGKDHTEILGQSLASIAKNKAGIINKGMKFYVPSLLDSSIKKYFKGDVKIIKNKGINYKEQNINLVKGILKDLKISPIIKRVSFRTQIDINNGYTSVKDVAHNADGIRASLKYLDDKKIEIERVVISIQKQKWNDDIKNMFKGKDIVFYKNDDSYYSKGKEIKDLSKEYNEQSCNTLYIGTFRTIKLLKRKINAKKSIKKIMLGNSNKIEITIFMITIGALLLSISQIIGYFIRFKIGTLQVSFDYVFYMIFGLFFGVIYGSIFSLINDLLKTTFVVGFGGWIWQYAILPPIGIVIFSSIFKEFVWNKNNKWHLIIIITFILIDIFALSTILINNATATYSFKKANHDSMMMLFYIFLPLFISLQIIVLILYWKLKNMRIPIKRFINSMTLTMLILVVFSWIWGPFAFIAYMNRFYDSNYTIENKYTLFLIPRVIKAIPEGFIWSMTLFSLYEIIDLSTTKILNNRW